VEKEGYPIQINTSIDPDSPFPDKKVEYIKADVLDAWQEDGKGKVKLSDGSVIESDVVVLATGNVAPRYLSDITGQSLKGKQGYYNLDDAGLSKANVNEADVTALIGMGNGAHFAVLSAIENGYTGKFILCSGDGTQPEIRDTSLEKEYRRKILTVDKCAAIKTQKNDLPAEEWWKLLEQEVVLARTQGFSRHDVIDSIVPDFNTMWRMMSDEQKGVFRKNHGTEWGQSRYRMPKVHSDAIQKLIDEGRLVYADGLVRDGAKTGISCDEEGGFKLLFEMDKGLKSTTEGIEQTTETIGGKQYKAVRVPKIVNNTGPSSKLQDMSPLIKGLEEKGFIAQHSLGGLRVDDSLHVINAEGNTQSLFYAIGPITSGDFYEAFTIPAIRRCSQTLGESVVRDHVLNNAKDFTPEYHPEVNEEGQIGYRKRVSTKSGDGSLPPH
jgi:uncharacterized NAD(P)/FAD-binding protein YdhS